MRIVLVWAVFAFTGAGTVLAQSEISRAVFGSGAIGGASASHAVQTTLGQPVAGTVTAERHTVQVGFWFGVGQASDVQENQLIVPNAFHLCPNLPNPVSSGTTFFYDVPQNGTQVRCRIYSLAGRLMRELVNQTETPGTKSVRWDATDDRGHSVASGICFVVMEAPGYRASRKVELLR